MKSIIIHSEAKRELDEAIRYYEQQKRGLGLDFLSEIEQAIEKIKINPKLGKPHNTLRQILNIEEPFPNHFYWPDLDIDLSKEIIKNPERFPLKYQ